MQGSPETNKMPRAPVLLVGVGNILLRDEGFGPHVIKALGDVQLPPCVELLDGGTAGTGLLDFIRDRQKVIFIDAVKADAAPGSIFRMTAEDFAKSPGQSISLHEFGLGQTLLMAKQLNCAPRQVILFGVTPKDISCGLELSAEVAAAIPGVIELILDELRA